MLQILATERPKPRRKLCANFFAIFSAIRCNLGGQYGCKVDVAASFLVASGRLAANLLGYRGSSLTPARNESLD